MDPRLYDTFDNFPPFYPPNLIARVIKILKNPPCMIIPPCACPFIRQVRVIQHFSFKKGKKKIRSMKISPDGIRTCDLPITRPRPMHARAQIRNFFVREFGSNGLTLKKACSR